MTYKVLDKIPRKYDFTKNRWPSVDYEKLEDKELNSKIEEIDKDTKKLKSTPIKYNQFLKEYKKIMKEHSDLYNNEFDPLATTYIKRDSKIIEYTQLIFFKEKYTEHDIYFSSKEKEEEFLELSNKIADIFVKALDLFNEFNNECGISEYRYFCPKDSFEQDDYGRYSVEESNHFPLWDGPFSKDIEKFTELKRKKWMTHWSFNPKPSTNRTVEFLTKLHSIGVKNNLVDTDKMPIMIPNMPTTGYAKWYFDKLIEENNKIRRRIELVLRSRKRSVELATNLNSIYVFSNKSYSKNTYKIGWTTGLPEDRADQLSSETGVLHPFKVMYSKQFKDAEKREKQIHKHFNEYRVRKNKEYFDLDLKKITNYIESIKETDIK